MPCRGVKNAGVHKLLLHQNRASTPSVQGSHPRASETDGQVGALTSTLKAERIVAEALPVHQVAQASWCPALQSILLLRLLAHGTPETVAKALPLLLHQSVTLCKILLQGEQACKTGKPAARVQARAALVCSSSRLRHHQPSPWAHHVFKPGPRTYEAGTAGRPALWQSKQSEQLLSSFSSMYGGHRPISISVHNLWEDNWWTGQAVPSSSATRHARSMA